METLPYRTEESSNFAGWTKPGASKLVDTTTSTFTDMVHNHTTAEETSNVAGPVVRSHNYTESPKHIDTSADLMRGSTSADLPQEMTDDRDSFIHLRDQITVGCSKSKSEDSDTGARDVSNAATDCKQEDMPVVSNGMPSTGVVSNGMPSTGIVSNGMPSTGVVSNGSAGNDVVSNGRTGNGVVSNDRPGTSTSGILEDAPPVPPKRRPVSSVVSGAGPGTGVRHTVSAAAADPHHCSLPTRAAARPRQVTQSSSGGGSRPRSLITKISEFLRPAAAGFGRQHHRPAAAAGSSGPESEAADLPPPVPPPRHLKPAPATSSHANKDNSPTDFTRSLRELRHYGWYWGPLNFEEAERMLASRPEGSFLVRDSADDRHILTLSFSLSDRVRHVRIEHSNGKFSFGDLANAIGCSTVVEFVEKAMQMSNNGRHLFFLRTHHPGAPPLQVRLLHPLSRLARLSSLRHWARFVILRHVRADHIDLLPLPNQLKLYLKEPQYYVEDVDDVGGSEGSSNTNTNTNITNTSNTNTTNDNTNNTNATNANTTNTNAANSNTTNTNATNANTTNTNSSNTTS